MDTSGEATAPAAAPAEAGAPAGSAAAPGDVDPRAPGVGDDGDAAAAADAGEAVGDGDAAAAAAAATVSLDLPASAVARVFKAKLPPGTVVSKEAKASAAKAASIFVLYLSSTCVTPALWLLPEQPRSTRATCACTP
jgi:hypothetical protein